MPSVLRNRLSARQLLAMLPIPAILFSASSAFAAAPEVVVDAQFIAQTGCCGQTQTSLNQPTSLTVAPNGTYYVADSLNNRVVAYTAGGSSTVNTTAAFPLNNPQAVAVDSLGDLFIGYSPAAGVGQVIEALATNGVLNGTVKQVVSGGPLKDVTALGIDTNSGSTTLNTLYIGDDVSFSIYSVDLSSTTPTLVNPGFTGLPPNILPAAIAKDAAGNLYIADFMSTLYEIPVGGKAASIYDVPGFTVFSPTGLWIDPKGDLLILTLTATAATPSQKVPQNIIEIPFVAASGLDTSSAFRIPITGLTNGSGLGTDQSGHVFVADNFNNNVVELVYGVPVGLSQVDVGKVGSSVTLNYELNTTATLNGFNFVSSGDTSTEIQIASGNCNTGSQTTGSDGTAISTVDPYVCQENVAASPAYPGLRYGAIQLKGTGTTPILASTEVFSTGIAGASVTYPLTASITASINNPVGMAVSGLDQHLYVVNNSGNPEVLRSNGPAGPTGTTFTPISTAPVVLVGPFGIAINGEGDLYVADSGGNTGIGQIVVVPAIAGQTPYGFNPGNLLIHPVGVAFDTTGNLFIADLGTAGPNGDPNNPGFIVEVPAGGGPAFKLSTGATPIYVASTIAADPLTGDLLVGDIGFVANGGGGSKVVRIPAGGGSAIDVPQFDNTQPAAIVFDPADEYYVLDGSTNQLTVVPPTGSSYIVPVTVGPKGSLINTAGSMAITNGGQNFIVGNTVNTSTKTTNDVVYLNGQLATLNFGSVAVGQTSPTQNNIVNNIGNYPLTLINLFVSFNSNYFGNYTIPSYTCKINLTLAKATTCDLGLAFQPSKPGNLDFTATWQTTGYLPNNSVLQVNGQGIPASGGAAVRRRR